jgi:hypothetical protein
MSGNLRTIQGWRRLGQSAPKENLLKEHTALSGDLYQPGGDWFRMIANGGPSVS